MLRSCAGWAKILCSCRTVPPSLQSHALGQADFGISGALGRLVGFPLSDDDWRLASLGISSGKARSAEVHAPVAGIASMSATANLSRRIWPAFGEYDLDSGSLRSDAVLDLRRPVPESAVFSNESVSFSQKALSSLIEARAFSDFMASDQVEVHRKPHLVLDRNPGAGARLTSLSDSSDTHLPPSLFTVSLRRYARPSGTRTLPVHFAVKTQDRWRDHALSCVCGRDWICRHTAVRDVVLGIARDCCSLTPVKEKPGLLPLQALDDVDPFPSSSTSRSDWATSAAQRTSGFPEVSQGRHRRGTSPSAAPFARPFGPQLPGTRSLFFSAWSFARPSSMTLLPAAQAWATFSALSTLKQLEGAGLLTLGSSPS